MTKEDKKADMWMPLWIGAYLADTMKLTTIQHGAYLLLLMAYWRERAPLEDNDDELRSIAKADKSEWKKLRPVLEKFFKVGDGVWWHKRVEAEIATANARQDALTNKAKAGARARWTQHDSDAPSNATGMPQAMPKHATSNAQALPEQCPTPSPSHIGIGIPTFVAKEVNLLDTRDNACVTNSGEVCKAMKARGIGDVNPSNQDLANLLQAGAELGEFEAAATNAVERHKGFKYALGIVRRTREEAAQPAPALHRGPLPKANPAPEPAWRTEQRNRTLQAVPSIADRTQPAQEFFDVESKNVTAIGLG